MKNKTIIMTHLLMYMAAFVCAVSCQAKPEEQNVDNVPLQVSVQSLDFTAEEGSNTFVITSTSKPSIVGRYDWCTAKASAFEATKTTVTVTVKKNEGDARKAEFSIVCGDEKKYVNVNQEASAPVDPLAFLNEPVLPQNSAMEVVKRLGMGWNLGNQFDSYNNGVSAETAWGNPLCTQATFDALKAKGFSTVRIPITWMGHIGNAPEYKIEKAWLDRIVEVAGYAKNAGLNAIINIHHDDNPEKGWLNILKATADQEVRAEIVAKFSALWKQVAERFADEGDWLIFEGYNEIQDGKWGNGANLTDGGKQYGFINELAQTFVNTVRATGGKNADRYLAVLGYSANPGLTMANLKLPEDTAKERLIISVHFYDPSGFAIGQNDAYTEWGHTGTVGKKDPNHNEENVIKTFNALLDTYLSKNIPVYIGECGCVNHSGTRAKAFQKYWFEFVFKAAKAYGLSPVIWDNGSKKTGHESFGFIDHATGDYLNNSKSIIDIVSKVFNTEDASYTLKKVYENAPM